MKIKLLVLVPCLFFAMQNISYANDYCLSPGEVATATANLNKCNDLPRGDYDRVFVVRQCVAKVCSDIKTAANMNGVDPDTHNCRTGFDRLPNVITSLCPGM